MDHDGMTYEDALEKAQNLGFAESDPTSDVGGFDAGRKMAILANLAFSMPIDLKDVRIKGIEGLNDTDLTFGKQLGYEMKLLGVAKIDQGAVEVSVGPTFIPHAHPLTSVHDEYNAVFVRGEAVGTTMFYGPGAGGLPTATSIVSDVVTVVKNMVLGTTGMTILAPHHEKLLKSEADIHSKYYLRLEVKDQVGVFAVVTALFATKGVSFEKIIQEPSVEVTLAEIIIVTHEISLLTLKHLLSSLEGIPAVMAIKSYYPIEQI
jgi:homoserine dehydrogenase